MRSRSIIIDELDDEDPGTILKDVKLLSIDNK